MTPPNGMPEEPESVDIFDGCGVDFAAEPATPDTEVGLVALFAGVPENEIEAKAAEYRALFNA